MEQKPTAKNRARNWIITIAAIAFAAAAVFVCLLLRPKAGSAYCFVIHYGDGKTLTVPAWETRTIVIRNGEIVPYATSADSENVVHIENGEAWMEDANCSHRECVRQGRLNGETIEKRPLGTWIVCAPHRVYIELSGGAQ